MPRRSSFSRAYAPSLRSSNGAARVPIDVIDQEAAADHLHRQHGRCLRQVDEVHVAAQARISDMTGRLRPELGLIRPRDPGEMC
jgi:hypothetical protein